MKIKKKVTGSIELTKALEILLPEPPVGDAPAEKLGQAWRMERDGISQSMIALFALCPQKAHWSLIEGLKKDSTFDKALDFGNFFHDVLDKVYTTMMEKDFKLMMVLDRTYRETKARMQASGTDTKTLQEFEITYGMCRTLLVRYFEKWESQDKQIKWEALEQVFAVPYKLRDGTTIELKGKFDGVFRDNKNRLWLFETKTKSMIAGNMIMETMSYNLQVMIYMKAIQAVYGEKPVGVLYNLVKRPGQQYKGSFNRKPESIPEYLQRIDKDVFENPNDYFTRYMINVQWEEVEKFFLMDLDYMLQRMYEWQQGGYSNFRNSAACSMWNRPCEYLPICSMGDRTNFTKKLTMFPELEVSK